MNIYELHTPFEGFHDPGTGTLDALGFLAEKAGGMNDLFDRLPGRTGQCLRGLVARKQDGGDLVHRLVRRLGR